MKSRFIIPYLSLFLLLISPIVILAQQDKPKVHYKQGIKFLEQRNYSYAIGKFTEAIKIDDEYVRAYLARAQAYEDIDSFELAMHDYEKADIIEKSDKEILFKIAEMCYLLEQYDKSLLYLDRALEIDNKYLDAHKIVFQIYIDTRQYNKAQLSANEAMEVKKNSETFYNMGLAFYMQEQYDDANNYFRLSYGANDEYILSIIGIANCYYHDNKTDQALATIKEALNKDDEKKYLKDGLLTKTKIHYKRNELEEAIQEISKVINMFPNDANIVDYYFKRGKYHSEFSQDQSGINDFSRVLFYNPNYLLAIYNRGLIFERLGKKEDAIWDLEKFAGLTVDSVRYAYEYAESIRLLFELQKESNKPQLTIISPEQRLDDYLDIEKDAEQLVITGEISDESRIEYVKINDYPLLIDNELMKMQKRFKHIINPRNVDKIEIEIADVYMNVNSYQFKIREVEVGKPVIYIDYPYTSGGNELYVEGSPANIIITGDIEDESLIAACMIDDVITVSYNSQQYNPNFSASLNIQNKDKFTIVAVDKFGNRAEQTYVINRDSKLNYENNPMGKTWAILIANYEYDDFVSLSGPVTEMTELYNTLLNNYSFAKVTKRENLNKEDFEELFQVELRKNVENYKINSLFIWYAGHGLFQNDMGYWIPVDATKRKEISYYSHATLKSHISNFSKDLDHLLIVSDACQSGNNYWEITRGKNANKDCNDIRLQKLKSKQVLTSANQNELASDDSKFAQIFINTLKSEESQCIPVDQIYIKAKESMERRGRSTPQFYTIPDSDDENGTFFFVRKGSF